ncbi:MAG: protein kinase [Solirubrobacteraceae bacterium]|nr:protein kinase [Solirubrobacteraceae bacterium]
MRDLPPIGSELGGYRLQSLIARGGMGVVYIAEDVRMGRTVALKVLASELAENERFRARFLHESRVAGAVNHPNVIPVYDAGEADGLLYISMRYVEGTDLRGLLQNEGALELDRTVSIVGQSASALAATHARDLIHRDVKPANILLVPRTSEDGVDHVYLSDFGLAKNLGTLGGLTKTGQFMGTVGYVAPEQIRGKDVDRRTDVYALGCVLFECLTGRPPFRRKDDFATIMAHVNDAPPLVSELRERTPAAIDEVVAQALAKAPEDRFDSCEDLGRALRRAAGRPSTEPSGAPSAVRDTPSASRGSVWFDADAEVSARSEAPFEPTEPGTVLEDDALSRDAAPPPPAEPPPPPPGSSPAGSPASGSPRKRIPVGARVLLGLAALGSVIALALVLLGGDGDDTERADRPTSPRAGTDANAGPWREIGAAPTARQQVATAVVDGRIWVVGGLVGTKKAAATNRVESYDPTINSWSSATPLPRPLHHATAVAYRGELVVIGGWEPKGSNLTAVASREVLALRDGRWVRYAPLRHPRAAAAAAVVDDKIVVTGGQADGKLVRQTEFLPGGVVWKQGADLPTPREHLAVAADEDGRFLYAVGGRDLSPDSNTRALERYDIRDDRWTKLPSMPVASGSLGAAFLKGRVVAIGGETSTGVIKSVQSYGVKSRRWSQLAALPTPRHGLGVAALGDTLYAIGGALGAGHLASTDKVEGLDLR